MHRALAVPEVLQLILSSNPSQSTLRNAALVCRLWKEPALDLLWKDLKSVFPLIWVLLPLKSSVRTRLITEWGSDSGIPPPENWTRFKSYAARIRTLAIDISATTGQRIPPSTLLTVAQYHAASSDPFRNLRKLVFNARRIQNTTALPILLMFLSGSVRDLELCGISAGEAPQLLGYAAQRAPEVENLHLPDNNHLIPGDLVLCLEGLDKLKSIVATTSAVTPDLWEALGRRPLLEMVYLALPLKHLGHVTTGISPPGSFSSLEKLALKARFTALSKLLQTQDSFPKLTRIVCEGPSSDEQLEDIGLLCSLLAERLPDLELVCLNCVSAPNRALGRRPLKFEHFLPLLQCNNVRYLHLEHFCGVEVTSEELAQMLDAWPRLAALRLQYSEYALAIGGATGKVAWLHPTLPITVLETIARKHPRIKELGLVVDASLGSSDLARVEDGPQFECLNMLELRTSTITGPSQVASYLVQLSKNRFRLDYEEVQSAYFTEYAFNCLQALAPLWKQVSENMEVLFDLRESLERRFEQRLKEERGRHEKDLRQALGREETRMTLVDYDA